MATPEPISIQIDPEALRKQVRDVIGEELREFGMRLRFAADQLDPDWIEERNANMESYFRGKWEAEQGGGGR